MYPNFSSMAGNNNNDSSFSFSSPDDSGLGLDGYDEDEFYALAPDPFEIEMMNTNSQDDLYLHPSDRQSIAAAATSVMVEEWTDRPISRNGEEVEFSIDTSTIEAWNATKEEIHHLRQHVGKLLSPPLAVDENINIDHLVDLCFGPRSDFATSFCIELQLKNYDTFIKFLGNMCLQMSYGESASGLTHKFSELKGSVLMPQHEYMEIWEQIANHGKFGAKDLSSSSRRSTCLWEVCETAANTFLRKIVVADRDGDLSVALDDDKVWVESSGENGTDDFGIRRVRHTQDNRKGVISHTAVSSLTTILLGFLFEKKGATAFDCFKSLFGTIFPSTSGVGLPNLAGVKNHSDRGYTLGDTVFKFLLPAGADFTNTVRRVSPFPFWWGPKQPQHDKRQALNPVGAPTLYVKEIVKNGTLVSCLAFRTGTNNISTIITNRIHGHQWEGIALNPKQRIKYMNNKRTGLDSLIFTKMESSDELFEEHKDDIKNHFQVLKALKIHVLTLEQGTADWFKARQFSLTSSQADGSFRKAFILYQENESWCKIATYLLGEEYHRGECEKMYFNLFYL